ncbi:hypothetical protein [Metabacillus endolithicus]|uniref:Uncharacterized protein n=1 Tax=Metabacillus endolithicus TaxID=1535204 RepID=A0ABW5BU99_9BACI|nr:hypothetical protein [Metabacillus endolithicus]UPG63641.1 hypothetical protein MVE64_00185 [Metabacillus endolithicus]
MNVKEYFEEVVKLEESSLAHYLFHLLQEKKISSNDDVSKIDLNQANHQIVEEMIQKNLLYFRKVHIYSLKQNKNDFVFIFARSKEDAIQHYRETYFHSPLNCIETSLENDFYRGNGRISFRDMKKEFSIFPAIAGSYSRNDYVLTEEEVWQQYK